MLPRKSHATHLNLPALLSRFRPRSHNIDKHAPQMQSSKFGSPAKFLRERRLEPQSILKHTFQYKFSLGQPVLLPEAELAESTNL